MDEEAYKFKVQYLHGRTGCICSRNKREGGAHYPGRSVGDAGGKDTVEILWHRRETSRKTEKTNFYLRACRKATHTERCG